MFTIESINQLIKNCNEQLEILKSEREKLIPKMTLKFINENVTIKSTWASNYDPEVSFGLYCREQRRCLIEVIFEKDQCDFTADFLNDRTKYDNIDRYNSMRFLRELYHAAKTDTEKERIKGFYNEILYRNIGLHNIYYDKNPSVKDIEESLNYVKKTIPNSAFSGRLIDVLSGYLSLKKLDISVDQTKEIAKETLDKWLTNGWKCLVSID